MNKIRNNKQPLYLKPWFGPSILALSVVFWLLTYMFIFPSTIVIIFFIVIICGIIPLAIISTHSLASTQLIQKVYISLWFVEAIGFILVFAYLYRMQGVIDTVIMQNDLITNKQLITHDKFTCLYFSIITFTQLGSGDVLPTPPARTIAMIEVLSGWFFLGVLISMITLSINTFRKRIS